MSCRVDCIMHDESMPKLADGELRGTGIWSTGRVVRVADGLTDKRSKRAQKVLPAGMVLWAWDADLDA